MTTKQLTLHTLRMIILIKRGRKIYLKNKANKDKYSLKMHNISLNFSLRIIRQYPEFMPINNIVLALKTL